MMTTPLPTLAPAMPAPVPMPSAPVPAPTTTVVTGGAPITAPAPFPSGGRGGPVVVDRFGGGPGVTTGPFSGPFPAGEPGFVSGGERGDFTDWGPIWAWTFGWWAVLGGAAYFHAARRLRLPSAAGVRP